MTDLMKQAFFEKKKNACWLDKMKKIENLSNQNDGFDEKNSF